MTGPSPGAPHSSPGAAVVGDLAALPNPVALSVLMLRDWCEGPVGRERVWSVLAGAMPTPAARAGLRAFEALVDVLVREGRRPLMRHAAGCRCVGSDEAVFAHLLAVAASGEREDAMLLTSLLLPGGLVPAAAHHAEQAGLALARLCLRPGAPRPERAPPEPPARTVH